MFGMKTVLVLGLLLATTACAPTDVATRMEADPTGLPAATGAATPADLAVASRGVVTATYDVQRVDVVVPRNLKVSEANMYYPLADIVWRGEPRGDRYAQVEAIYKEAADRATAGMGKGEPVVVTVEVTRFHALTEKTRYSVGGTHSLHFLLTVTDASTGQVIDGPRRVVADVKAAGGQKAIDEEARGLTQRVVIVNRLTEVLQRELSVRAGGSAPAISALPSLPSAEAVTRLANDLTSVTPVN